MASSLVPIIPSTEMTKETNVGVSEVKRPSTYASPHSTVSRIFSGVFNTDEDASVSTTCISKIQVLPF